ncbi:hypothetical protein UlMin_035838 [Ulmus minor]
MGHEHNQATDGLLKLLTKANHDLSVVQHKLEREFQQIYPENANPMKLVSRMKKIQEDILGLKEQCRVLLSAKQDLIDKARAVLVGNRSSVQRMQASMSIPIDDDSGDSAFANFNQIIDEWTTQVRTRTGDEKHGSSDTEDVNKLLFSTIVESN